LGIDYMFGTSGFDDKTYCVKLNPEDFAPDFFRLIFGTDGVETYSAFDYLGSFYSPELVNEDGKYAIRMRTYYSHEEFSAQYNIPDNTIYLVVNDVTIASADVTSIKEEDGKYYLDFENFLCFGGAEVTKEEENILNLICDIPNNEYIYFDGTFRFRTNGNTDRLDSFNWKYNPLTAADDVVFNTVSSLGHKVEKMVDARNMLVITLDIEVSDSLAEEFLNAAKEVYLACNFDTGAYNEIHIVVKDETIDSPADKFRLEITKDTFEGEMEIYDRVSGPKFSSYWSDVYSIMEEDSFYSERSI